MKERSRDDDRLSFIAVKQANDSLILHREPHDSDSVFDGPVLQKEAAQCSERVKVDLARGVPPDETYYFDRRSISEISPSNAEEKVCKPLAAIADGWAARIAAREQREQASDASLAAPYKKAGIDGDKLAFIVRHDGEVYLAGQIRATPQSAARATVLFEELVDGEGRTVVLRLTYAGNREVSRSSRAYIDPPGPSAYR